MGLIFILISANIYCAKSSGKTGLVIHPPKNLWTTGKNKK